MVLVLAGIAFAALQVTRGRKGAGAAEYFLASRSVGWLALAVSLSVTTIWGLWSVFAGMPVSSGLMGWVIPGCAAVVGLVLLGLVFAPLYRTSNAATIPAFLGERYGRSVGVAVAGVSIAVTLLVRIPFTILIGSRLLNALLGWEIMSSALLMIVVPGLFVIAGGYHAVIATHGAGGIAAGAGVLFLAFNGFFPTEAMLHRAVPEAEGSLVPLVTGVAVVGLWFTCIDQYVVQRVIAARSCAAMRGGAALAALLVVLGVVAIATGFDTAPAEGAQLIGSSVAAGFVGAAIVAFGMASLSGLFMSAATVFAMDVFLAGRKRSDEAALVLVGRLANTVIVILAIMAASSIALTGAGSIHWMARALAIALPPVVAILLLGLVWSRMHGRGAFWALVIGWGAGVGFSGMSAESMGAMMQGVLLTFALSALVCVGVSLATAPRGELGSVMGTIVHEGLQVRKP
jgi:SSS family solute:Na+ symporter